MEKELAFSKGLPKDVGKGQTRNMIDYNHGRLHTNSALAADK
jgi:hypothetical protein